MLTWTYKLLSRYRHINWTLADQALVSGANFFTTVVIARVLGIQDFGLYSLVWMVVLIIQSIHYTAINAPMMSIGPKLDGEESVDYYGGVLGQHLLLNAGALLLTWFGVHVFGLIIGNDDIRSLALPIAVCIFCVQSHDYVRRYFFCQQEQRKSFASDAVRYLLQFAFLFWLARFVHLTLSVNHIIWIQSATAALGIAVVSFSFKPLRLSLDNIRRSTSRNWRSSRWLLATNATNLLSGNLFIVAAGSLLGTTAVGALKAAQNLMGLAHVFYLGFENFVPFGAARHFRDFGGQGLWRYLKRTCLFGTSVTAIVGIVLASVPEFWTHLFFGDQYVEFSYLVRFYAILYVTSFFGQTLDIGLRTLERTTPTFSARLLGAAMSIVLAYPMVLKLGVSGAVAGMLIVQITTYLLLFLSFRRELQRTPMS